METSQPSENDKGILEEIDKKYERTAVGCIIGYLKAYGHSPIEALVEYVSTKRDRLLTSSGGKFSKSAFEIVNYVLAQYPNIFKLDGHSHYNLNEEEASRHEYEYKNQQEKRHISYMLFKARKKKSREDELQKAQAMRRIKAKIESELQGSSENYSPMTKAYLILISDNKEAISDLTRQVRQAYIQLIRPSS